MPEFLAETMPAITCSPRSRPNSAPAWPGDRAGQEAARQQPAHDPHRELSVTRGMPAQVMEHLHQHHVITLATTSFTGIPHAGTAVYASDSTSVFFFAVEGTQMLRNIQDSRRVSFTIDGYTAGWRKVRELQGAGRCLPATAEQDAAAWPLYLSKFGPGFARPRGLMHAIIPAGMHFVDHDHAVVTGQPAPIRRTFQIEDAGAVREAMTRARLRPE
jgi:uncharacterized protein YhbP (UPF0306 family)